MFCKNCGAQIEDGSKFCCFCGTQVESEINNNKENIEKNVDINNEQTENKESKNDQADYNQNNVVSINANVNNLQMLDYTPIGAWGYFGYALLCCIPIVGIIVIIVMSITAKNIHKRNYFRAMLVVRIIGYIIYFIAFSKGVFDMYNIMRNYYDFFNYFRNY